VQLRQRNMQHHPIIGAIDRILVIKHHWQADDGGLVL
jgi:hypothetical protein